MKYYFALPEYTIIVCIWKKLLRTLLRYLTILRSTYRHTVTVSTLRSEDFVVTSNHADDLYLLLNKFMDGLRRKSKYGIAVQDSTQLGKAYMKPMLHSHNLQFGHSRINFWCAIWVIHKLRFSSVKGFNIPV